MRLEMETCSAEATRSRDEVVYSGRFDSEAPSVGDTGVVRAVSEERELERDEEDIVVAVIQDATEVMRYESRPVFDLK